MSEARVAAQNRKTVLIVEDCSAVAQAIQRLLEEEGLNVLWALDGKAGVQTAQQCTPDAMVLDVKMPKMNGLEACQRLKENARTADVPVVMLTVRDDATTAWRGIALGAIDFIPKDAFSDHVLLETLRQLHILPEPEGAIQC